MATRKSLILGIAVILLGVSYPFFQSMVLEAAFGLEVSLMHMVLAGFSIVLGFSLVLVSRSRLKSLRIPLSVVNMCLLGLLAFCFSYTTWTSLIGPKAVVEVPDDFHGEFRIVIERFVEPSWHTRGRTFYYPIEGSGTFRFGEGWVGLTFGRKRNSLECVLMGPYYTLIKRRNGKGLNIEAFDFDWLPPEEGKGIFVRVK